MRLGSPLKWLILHPIHPLQVGFFSLTFTNQPISWNMAIVSRIPETKAAFFGEVSMASFQWHEGFLARETKHPPHSFWRRMLFGSGIVEVHVHVLSHEV